MGLKDKWVDKVDGVDEASAEDINQVAHAVIELEKKEQEGSVSGDYIPAPTTATVGQTIRVSSVDDIGKPTAWEAVDFPEGGGDGRDGGYYVPAVSQPEFGVMRVSYVASADGMPAVEPVDVPLPQGEPGDDYVLTDEDKAEIAAAVPAEIYVGDGEMPDDAVLQFILDGEDEEQALKDALKEYVDEQLADFAAQVNAKLPINQGAANVGKILVVGSDGNLTLTDMPEGGASGDVTGALDESNNILLTGSLADGTYTLKYQNEDGTYTVIGTLEVGAIPEPEEPEVTKTNFCVPDGDGWIDGGRCGSDGTDRTDNEGYYLTNYIPAINGDVVYVENFHINTTEIINQYCGMYKADADKTPIKGFIMTDTGAAGYCKDIDLSGDIKQFTIDNANSGFVRIVGELPGGKAKSDIVINVKRNGEWL